VVAAVYLDAGFDRTQTMVNRLFDEPVQQILASSDFIDYKSGLQEFTQEHFGKTPYYTLAQEKGPDHDKTFEICLDLDTISTMGSGKTKKAAEQDAARKALAMLNRNLD
jgi:dsRNA-specific ribonuclease